MSWNETTIGHYLFSLNVLKKEMPNIVHHFDVYFSIHEMIFETTISQSLQDLVNQLDYCFF